MPRKTPIVYAQHSSEGKGCQSPMWGTCALDSARCGTPKTPIPRVPSGSSGTVCRRPLSYREMWDCS